MKLDNNGDAMQYTGNGSRVPAPPKRGEVIICQMCGQALLPQHFSKDPIKRKREFKWHIHPECFETMSELCDRGVPGLVSERKKAEERSKNGR